MKVNKAIDILRRFCPFNGYFLAFSGGKDSICCYHLLKLSGVKFEAHYSVTSVDEPFVKPFIRKNYQDVIFDNPKLSMFQLIEKKGILPIRNSRFCCEFLKEYSGKNRLVITGIRKQESFNRSKRRLFEIDSRKNMLGKAYLNIICDWTEDDVWFFIKKYKLIIPEYYAENCRSARGGCVGCPMNTKQQINDFIKYPKYKKAYLKAIKKAMNKNKFNQFVDEYDVMEWWVSNKSVKGYIKLKSQLKLYENC